MTNLHQSVFQAATELGMAAGRTAAEWAAQDIWGSRVWSPSKASSNARAFLQAFDDGEDLCQLRAPDLSGEWADSPTPQTLLAQVLPPGVAIDADVEDEICRTWTDAAESAFWSALVASAAAAISSDETCAYCGEYWPCSDSKRRDIRGELRACHVRAIP
jgi:hypothetical protein